jgi:murein DD-endopeptidase
VKRSWVGPFFLICGVLCLLSASVQCNAQPGRRPLDVPLDIVVPMAPTVFRAGGKVHLVYELHVTNFGRRTIALARVEARGGDGKPSLARYEGAALASVLERPDLSEVVGLDKLRIGPGLRAVVYMWITLDSPAAVPSALDHGLTIEGEPDTHAEPYSLSVHGPTVLVRKEIATIGPPLRGGVWQAVNGPSNTSAHRRALIPVNGRAVIAQRFAIDWVRLGKDRETFTGDARDNRSYHAYGAEALAVADGVVTAMKDGIPQNVPGIDSHAVAITMETIAGNHVIVDIGQGRYALYAHLQPGSLRVKVGDRVRRGQVLALVGNSGNTTEPHLHFHLTDASSPLGAEGIPYAFESFGSRGGELRSSDPVEKRQNDLPAQDELVTFP